MKKILLADDSLTIQKVVELTFLDEDFAVESVGSGDAARTLLSEDLDILITDIHVPGASGYDLCREAKQAKGSLPVLLLVGTFETLDEERFAECGADGFLQKPFDAQDLLRTVGELVAGAEEQPSERELEAPDASGAGIEAAEPPVASEEEHREAGVGETNEDFAEDDGETLEFVGGSEPDSMGPDIGAGQDDEAESGGERPADLGEAVVADSAVETERVPGLITADEPVLAPMEEGDPELAEGLSDEVVERIAQRVVELMGSDIVREIAWDVVPDLAEVVVKERLRELEAEVD